MHDHAVLSGVSADRSSGVDIVGGNVG
jgi:hypothetical protein